MAIALSDLLTVLDPVAVTGNVKVKVDRLCIHSRHVRPGSMFAALVGAREDGWRYVQDAIKRGAVAILSAHPAPRLEGKICHIQVSDASLAAGQVAAMINGEPAKQLTMIAITGTNGKTTTACLIRDMLKAAGIATGLIGTIQYEIGTRVIPASRTTPDAATLHPLLRQMVDIGCTHCVMEVSSHAIVQQRIAGIAFNYAVFTNLTQDHLDYHGSMEAYYEAKAALFRSLPASACAVINTDDEWGRRLAGESLPTRVLRYGLSGGEDVNLSTPLLSATGASFTVRTPQGERNVQSPLLGRHNLYNALAAIAVCGDNGVSLSCATGALRHDKGAPGRLEPVPTGGDFHVFVDYAHTDDALHNVLTALRELTRERLIVVFGCGGDRDASKRPAMGRVAATLADRVIVTSDNPRREDPEAIIRDILAGIDDDRHVSCEPSRAAAIEQAVRKAGDGDVVLIAGKGHERVQEFGDHAVPFDDREKVKEALRARV